MKNRKIALSLAAGIPALALMVMVMPALAGQVGSKSKLMHRQPTAEMQQQMEALKSTIENNDYEAFKALADTSRFKDIAIDESVFTKIVEAHKLRNSGDHKGARALLEEIGLKVDHHGHGAGKHHQFKDLSDDQKSQLEEARKLFNGGDKEGAKALFEEIRMGR